MSRCIGRQGAGGRGAGEQGGRGDKVDKGEIFTPMPNNQCPMPDTQCPMPHSHLLEKVRFKTVLRPAPLTPLVGEKILVSQGR
ncbi:MAG: hypothetical protein ACRAVC_19315 [Trichormus sp.]